MMRQLPQGWRRAAFGNVLADVSAGNAKVPTGRLQSTGTFPVVDQGQALIAGYSDCESDLCKSELPAIVFGDHTRCFKFVEFPFCMGADGTKILRPVNGDDPRYLYYFLRQISLPEAGYSRHFKFLKECEIVLPPLPEQRRIAEVLDRVEGVRARRHAAISGIDALTESIFLEMFGDPARNTRNLPTISLGELGTWQSGGTPSRARSDYFEGVIPWFSSGELNEMYVGKSKEYISESALRETSAKLVARGSLMLGMYDTAALKASIADIRCSCNQAIAFAAINPDRAETVFVYYAIMIGREQFRRLQRGVRQKNLNLSMVREICIPLAPLHLQREFACRAAAVEKLKGAQRTSLANLNALFTSLQHRAFRGEL